MHANCLTPKPLGVIFYNTRYYFLYNPAAFFDPPMHWGRRYVSPLNILLGQYNLINKKVEYKCTDIFVTEFVYFLTLPDR